MPRTHFQDFERDDGTPITLEFTATGGCPAHMGSLSYAGHPAEGPEIEIVGAYAETGRYVSPIGHPEVEPVTLTDAEDERMRQWLLENFVDDHDDYYED